MKASSSPPGINQSAGLSGFAAIYDTDLVYVPDCWRLCGDAHCCSFSRYKAKFKLIASSPFQELPLLPREYEFLASQGWLAQFEPYEHRVLEFKLDAGIMKVESIVSRKSGCPCDHATRPTICRLYPFLPIFETSGRFIGTDLMGIYEEMEAIDGMEPACKVQDISPDQAAKLLTISEQIAGNLKSLYYISAYRIAKGHVANRLRNQQSMTKADVFAVFENAFIRGQISDREALTADLNGLFDVFVKHYGADLATSSIFSVS